MKKRTQNWFGPARTTLDRWTGGPLDLLDQLELLKTWTPLNHWTARTLHRSPCSHRNYWTNWI
jgi:hypothetical protein